MFASINRVTHMPMGCGHMAGAGGGGRAGLGVAGGQGLLGREGREGHITLASRRCLKEA